MTKIVGLRHRNVDPDSIDTICKGAISLKREHGNKHDKFAVQCWFNNQNIGYIEASKSEIVSRLLDQSKIYGIKVLRHDRFAIDVELKFELVVRDDELPAMEDGVCGIYKITFTCDGERFAYFGQSVDINKRLRAHYRDLSSLEHHNDLMQTAWLSDRSSFVHSVVEKAPANQKAIDRQIFLFQREFFHIKSSPLPTANKLDADMVLTEEAKDQLQQLVKSTKANLKSLKVHAQARKLKIGERFIALGILKEEKFWDGYQRGGEPNRYLTVSASNILTWLHKRRRSPLDHIPNINYDHPQFDELKIALENVDAEMNLIGLNAKYLDGFFSSLTKKGKFDTCKIEDLERFLKIVKDYHS